MLANGHMTRLRFALDLFWLCVCAVLADEFAVPFDERAREVERLELCLESNASRLRHLAALNPKSVPRTLNNQKFFIAMLRALHANPHDWSAPPDTWRQALAQVLRAIRSALWLGARAQTDQLVSEDMKRLGGTLGEMADNLDDMIVQRLLALVMPTWAGRAATLTLSPGTLIPIIADKSLMELLTAHDLIIGLAQMAVERRHAA